MRHLTRAEKDLVKKIHVLSRIPSSLRDTIKFEDLFSKQLVENINIEVKLKEENNSGYLKFEYSRDVILISILREIKTITKLIKLLQDNDYLIKYQIAVPYGETIALGSFNSKEQGRTTIIYDRATEEFLTHNIQSLYFVENTLGEFIDRGFITKEERRYKLQFRFGIIGLILAFLTSSLNIWKTYNEAQKQLPHDTAKRLKNLTTPVDTTGLNAVNVDPDSIACQ
jgi:hypothetical protein